LKISNALGKQRIFLRKSVFLYPLYSKSVVALSSCIQAMKTLIIGYGNPFRRDDGFGWRVIDALKAAPIEGMEVIQTLQLMPELAEDISHASLVIFVDASVEGEPGKVQVRPVQGGERPAPNYTHYVAPEELMGMAEVLYGRQPDAWLITVTGKDFDLGEGLSPIVDESIPKVITQIRACCLNHFRDNLP
jgi:hydrogenase maturation protease